MVTSEEGHPLADQFIDPVRPDDPQATRGTDVPSPIPEPSNAGMLDVGDGQRIYWETTGNPDAKAAVFLHGGPGSGCSLGHRRTFDPLRYHGVLFDQRGCGRSVPHAAEHDTTLLANTTQHLVADIEALRTHLGIERWLVFGGSWGSTLAFAYAQTHPDRVTEMVHVAVTNTTRAEVDWLYGDIGRLFPEAWAAFRAGAGGLPENATGTQLATAYDALLNGPDPAVRAKAARDLCDWEDAIVASDAGRGSGSFTDDPRKALAMARICSRYFSRHGFLDDRQLLRDAHRIAHIPTALIHGQLDLGSPPIMAWRMAQELPNANLELIAGAGHSTGPGMSEAIGLALDRFAGN